MHHVSQVQIGFVPTLTLQAILTECKKSHYMPERDLINIVRRAFVDLMLDLKAYGLTHTPADLLDYALQQSDYAAVVEVCFSNPRRKPCCVIQHVGRSQQWLAPAATRLSLMSLSATTLDHLAADSMNNAVLKGCCIRAHLGHVKSGVASP